MTNLSYNRANNVIELEISAFISKLWYYILLVWLLMNKKIHDLLYRNLFPMLKHYIEILIRKYFQECLSPTFTKSTWAKLVRNILTINTCLVHPWKLNQIQASLVLKARQVINFADWCLMTSFMLSCVDAGLMTHSKCNDNDVAGVLPTLQL